ncbi:VRR-NUC domain-containing protein [Lactococcus lactis]|uniref:VRR-NUC domain-containing protein n=1 Tax=Lactococcus lactis TaxID=1358 RepID=UPI001D093CED|nr:VRR-NUC domain-containing protein [Lactococcus lactis]MCB6852853.1 VRR-NUC domain-containing protein [Lactococcus lactis]MDU6581383.1 VRR-NUC domain-containing protein [Lactococcus lactis]
MKTEHDIQNEIRLGLAEKGIMCFRANVGRVKMKDGRWFDTGLPKGHADLYGFRPDGQVFYIEVKSETGRVRPDQINFLETMRKNGALAGIARSVEDAMKIING